MIDIHSHILPGVDDGAQTVADAIAMAREAVKEGIATIIATPHYKNGKYDNEKQSIMAAVTRFNETIKQHKIPLTVLPGQEIRIHGDLQESFEKGEVLPIAGDSQYLLIEFPFDHVPRYADRLLFDLQLKGLIPVIAHPERNAEIIENPDRLYELVKKGVLTQLTAASVSGHFGKNIKKFSLQLIEANLAHFIASDAHNTTSRPFRLREAYDVIDHEFGINAVYFFQENAELLLNGQAVYREEPERIKRKKFLGLF
ncbi:tyrosine-protein phosphatase [Parageobacillus thermoglucosidasius]|jgi:protein-tyrosine phosphatase|uniref:Tyrosine-protein phosphatase n=3 Tax=Anoxybacillaceae TaxID=3120669 RepID=A0AAN0YN15_PARTM|nr:CpsB/CapC family capsule biosynthesis tyrosine phosphatase [Parageobacillus thermoglucosidasius]KYD11894.1 Manganese-dependent protein-tyrosine phosphatase [Anoxybacillus flavithermus]REK57133.1 MAG: tyrosine protein phosphatase [Geobacillus sp.]ALF09253.1 tyrosine protein phosphatase [Parageobacillus thermoglucosidasius]ANZ29336.1 tyrosine protein phosphatase [Parageobacillus thermoglucosidasius]APM80074.1 tyrosine protein phosphatase [Parageobacillus thermoglucosidasius]